METGSLNVCLGKKIDLLTPGDKESFSGFWDRLQLNDGLFDY